MKKAVSGSVFLAVGLVVATTACSSPSAEPESEPSSAFGLEADPELVELVPEELRGSDISVAVYNDYPPDMFLDEDGELAGWTMDLADAASDLLGVGFDYEPVGFDAIIPGLQNGRYDMALSSLNPLPERREVLDFVSLRTGGGSFATAADRPEIAAQDDLCGLSVAAAQGSTNAMDVKGFSDECVAAGEPAIEVNEFPQMTAGILAVQSGRADVVTAATTTLLYATSKEGGDLVAQPWSTEYVPQCVGFPNDSAMAEPFARAIDELIESGVYQDIMEEWGVEDLGTIEKSEVIR